MRLKCFILSILLLSGMDLFSQESGGVYAVYDFAIRNAAAECFTALRDGDAKVYTMLLSEQAGEEGSDFPAIVRSMSKSARAEVPSAASSLSPLRPYIGYEYRYISYKDISYVIGMAVAEYQDPEVGVTYNMIARPLYFVYTDRGWKAFWIGRGWKQARFADKDQLVVLDTDNSEVPVSTSVGKLRDEFYTQLAGATPKPQTQTQTQSKPKQQTSQQASSQKQQQTAQQKTQQKQQQTTQQKQQQTTQQKQQQTTQPKQPSKPVQSQQPKPESTKAPVEAVDTTIAPVSYEVATVKPLFLGQSASTFTSWVNNRVKYPSSARKDELAGKAKIKFVVDQKGNVRNVRLAESSGKRTKQEFEEQVNWASFLCEQYHDELARLEETGASKETIDKTRKFYTQAQQRLSRLTRLARNQNYVLPEYSVLDNEALRVVESSPKWEPGEYEGKPVPVEYTVTVDMRP